MLTRLLPPLSGCATVGGFDIVTQATLVRRRIGYVPQMLSADGTLTGYENLLVSARLYNVRRIVHRGHRWPGLESDMRFVTPGVGARNVPCHEASSHRRQLCHWS